MSKWTIVENARTQEITLARAKICASFFCRLRGLLFVSSLAEGEGAIFVLSKQTRVFAAVHTIGMRFSIGIIWLDKRRVVVDKAIASPRRFFYLPKASAKYYIESPPSALDRARIGDMLIFDKELL